MQVWGFQVEYAHTSMPEARRKAAQSLIKCVTNLDLHCKEASSFLNKYSSKPNTKIVKCIEDTQ
jgi:hypothetical protein